jgi:flagellar basal-body rod modification protein FlgD
MSDTSSVSKIGSSSNTDTSKVQGHGNNKLGKNEFLKILTTQLQYQDPTEPMDNSQFVAQLAQFSSLEQMQNVNTTLEQLVTAQMATAQNTVISMVGKDATYDSKEMVLSDSGSSKVKATLAAQAADVTMTVSTLSGTVVRRQSFGALKAGVNELTWDGHNDKGEVQAAGTYLVSIAAADLQGKNIGVTQFSSGRITGVSFVDGAAQLLLGSKSVPLSQVQQIQEAKITQ